MSEARSANRVELGVYNVMNEILVHNVILKMGLFSMEPHAKIIIIPFFLHLYAKITVFKVYFIILCTYILKNLLFLLKDGEYCD